MNVAQGVASVDHHVPKGLLRDEAVSRCRWPKADQQRPIARFSVPHPVRTQLDAWISINRVRCFLKRLGRASALRQTVPLQ